MENFTVKKKDVLRNIKSGREYFVKEVIHISIHKYPILICVSVNVNHKNKFDMDYLLDSPLLRESYILQTNE